MAQTLLESLSKKSNYGKFSLVDVEEVLSDPSFSTKEGLVTVLENGVSKP